MTKNITAEEKEGDASSPSAKGNAEAILDAAEELFAWKGFAAVSMRMIATKSKQHLASANYYFGSKAGLFEAAFLRHIVPVNRQRIALLNEMQKAGPATIEAVVDCYLSPLFEEDTCSSGGARARLIMLFSKQVLTNPDEHEYLQAYYEEVSCRFISAIRESLPGLSKAEAIWGYNYMVGILIFTLAGKTPMARVPDEFLSELNASESSKTIRARLIRFICAGLVAMREAP